MEVVRLVAEEVLPFSSDDGFFVCLFFYFYFIYFTCFIYFIYFIYSYLLLFTLIYSYLLLLTASYDMFDWTTEREELSIFSMSSFYSLVKLNCASPQSSVCPQ
jgi:hypothetical protein